MKDLKVINAIKHVCNYDVVKEKISDEEIELTISNYDYYIRPSKRMPFVFFLSKVSIGDFGDGLVDPNTPEERQLSMALVGLIRMFFDKSYFEEQIKKLPKRIDNTQLEKHIKELNKEELKYFFILVITKGPGRPFFISSANFVNMCAKLNEESRKINNSIPPMSDGTGLYRKYIFKNPLYYFDYLSTKQIANIICDSIDKHICEAENVVKLISSSGCAAAQNYLKNLKFNF